MSKQEQITAAIEAKTDDYNRRYFAPTPQTLARWKREKARELDRKDQLPLPLDFNEPPTPTQSALFDLE